MSDYALHPQAFADLDEIWEYIAGDNVDAADRLVADVHTTLRILVASPHLGHRFVVGFAPTRHSLGLFNASALAGGY